MSGVQGAGAGPIPEVARAITVGEAHFFRHRSQLEIVSEHVLRVARGEGRQAEVWSAGCASGEEPFSLALSLHQSLGEQLPDRVTIVGSDVNQDAVARARKRVYTSGSFRAAPIWVLAHFEARAARALELCTRPIVSAVRFEVAAVQLRAARQPSAALDAILFRNVAVHVESAAVRALYEDFARLLAPGGLLAIGPGDPRPDAACFEAVQLGEHAPIYRRKGAPEQVPVAATLLPMIAAPSVRDAERALASAQVLSVTEPDSATAQRLLGLARLELDRPHEAIAALRRALFLDPEAAIARCFYALALASIREPSQALLQIELLCNKLGVLAEHALLEDGETRAGELLITARFLRQAWR
jgi:chemotaxis protein methyltransferase CheR